MGDSFVEITDAFDSPRKLLRILDSGTTEDNGTAPVYFLASGSGLGIPPHDYVELSYTGDNLTGAVFKSGGTTVATLTLTYDVNDNLKTVTKT